MLEYSDTACMIGGAESHLLCNIVSQNVFKKGCYGTVHVTEVTEMFLMLDIMLIHK